MILPTYVIDSHYLSNMVLYNLYYDLTSRGDVLVRD